jgi:CBS domain-containing protein
MTRQLVTLSPSMSLRQMDEILTEHSLNGAPVLEKDKLVGIASRADAIRLILDDQTDAARVSDAYSSPFPISLSVLERLSSDSRSIVRRIANRRVRDVMIPSVRTVLASDPLESAASVMAREGIHRLPVLEDGRLVGIVTSLDLVRVMAEVGLAREA